MVMLYYKYFKLVSSPMKSELADTRNVQKNQPKLPSKSDDLMPVILSLNIFEV